MTDHIMGIFQRNKELLAKLTRAVIYFRECDYEKALELVAETKEGIRAVTDAVLAGTQYFEHVSVESVAEMLSGITQAEKKRDYILLADLLELQVVRFLCNIQTLIVEREDFCAFDEDAYQKNLEAMKRKISRSTALFVRDGQERELRIGQVLRLLEADLYPEQLLEQGYCVEFTSCGEMTVGVPDIWGETIYLHTNHHVAQESFLLARSWLLPEAKKYVIFGFGMGYVVRSLLELLPEDAVVVVYENDMNLLKLACAFTDTGSLLADRRLRVVYDPDCRFIRGALRNKDRETKVCVHYPSLCHLVQQESREMLLDYLPWARSLEVY
ncbi:MAG: hypothetical protein K2N63_02895 [Lachnospiraceae bacterium]|nr:hypothetical protein [Lachnospiraceae bacterium]